MSITSFPIGDSCVYYRLGETLSVGLSEQVIGAYRHLLESDGLRSLGVTDVVPAYTGVALYFEEPLQLDAVDKYVEEALKNSSVEVQEGRAFVIPVAYTGADIERVCSFADIGVRELIEIHTSVTYIVAMIGFLPHFPYLLGLDKRLHVPRLDEPRVSVPAGSLAIGGAQTGVYPEKSPGGWNVIGSCDPQLLLDIQPGDRVSFTEVTDAA